MGLQKFVGLQKCLLNLITESENLSLFLLPGRPFVSNFEYANEYIIWGSQPCCLGWKVTE